MAHVFGVDFKQLKIYFFPVIFFVVFTRRSC